MWLSIYKNLMRQATPLLEAYLARRLKRGKEDPARSHERRGKPTRSRGERPLVWFHAASVGESLSLLALVRRMVADYPYIQVMVTTGTVTSAKLMAERLPAGAFHQYVPVDHPDWAESFLNHWRPDLVIWAESELWPSLLTGVRRRNIPAVLVNARMSQGSFRLWRLMPGLIAPLLQAFQLCLAQNKAEADRLSKLGAPAVRVSGNLKYAAAPLPYEPAVLESLKQAVGARPRLLWAATHPGEEEIACRLHRNLARDVPGLLTIIVPRHPQRGAEILAASGLKGALRSTGALPSAADDVYVADTIGEMGLFYRLSTLCIVGGSFVPHGGHNIIEPGQLGCQVFYGPHMFNFISICHDFESRGASCRAADARALEKHLLTALKDPLHFAPMSAAALAWTHAQVRVVEEMAAELAPFMHELKAGAA